MRVEPHTARARVTQNALLVLKRLAEDPSDEFVLPPPISKQNAGRCCAAGWAVRTEDPKVPGRVWHQITPAGMDALECAIGSVATAKLAEVPTPEGERVEAQQEAGEAGEAPEGL